MIGWLSKHIFYPLWDIKDRSVRLKMVQELERTQWMSESELRSVQWQRLKEVMAYAVAHCPYYRKVFHERRIAPAELTSAEEMLKIPILTKGDVREHLNEMISDRYAKESLIKAKTGGSTGKALTVYFDNDCQAIRNAAAIRSDRWARWEPGMKRAAVWGNPPIAGTLKQKIRNALHDRTIYLDTMEMNAETMSDFIRRWRRYRPEIVFGHSHSIYILTQFLAENGIQDIRPKGVVSTSMMLLPSERNVIERVFGCHVTNRYGCEEVGLIACECEQHEGMHLNIDHLYIEFVKEDGALAGPGEEGQIVVTDLINRGMPMIRYKVEDVGVSSDEKCSCGRGLPLMERVTGRMADFLKRRDGSLVAGVSLIERTLTAIRGIGQMQIVQDEIGEIVLNVVPMDDYDRASEKALLDEFALVFGREVRVRIRCVDRIQQEPSGKYRFAICNVKGAA